MAIAIEYCKECGCGIKWLDGAVSRHTKQDCDTHKRVTEDYHKRMDSFLFKDRQVTTESEEDGWEE